MKSNYIVKYRCFGYKSRKDNKYYAFCIDLNLVVQGNTSGEVKSKLGEHIAVYLNTALQKQDDVDGLFPYRRAPVSVMIKYYIISCICRFSFWRKQIKDNYMKFTEIFQGRIENYEIKTV